MKTALLIALLVAQPLTASASSNWTDELWQNIQVGASFLKDGADTVINTAEDFLASLKDEYKAPIDQVARTNSFEFSVDYQLTDKYTPIDDRQKIEAIGQFLVFEITYKNISNKPIDMEDDNWALIIDDKKFNYSPDIGEDISYQGLNAELSRTGILAFDIPADIDFDSVTMILEYNPGIFTSQQPIYLVLPKLNE